MLLSSATVDFHLFYDGAVDIQIWTLLKRSYNCSVESLILKWPLRPLGLLLSNLDENKVLNPPCTSPTKERGWNLNDYTKCVKMNFFLKYLLFKLTGNNMGRGNEISIVHGCTCTSYYCIILLSNHLYCLII